LPSEDLADLVGAGFDAVEGSPRPGAQQRQTLDAQDVVALSELLRHRVGTLLNVASLDIDCFVPLVQPHLDSSPVSDPYVSPDFSAAALITIDTQRDVLDGGPLEVPGTSVALGAIRALTEAFREADRSIVHIVRLYRPDGANVDLCRRQRVEKGARFLAPGTPGSQLASPLLPADLTLDEELLVSGGVQSLGPMESVIYKPRWGAFYETPLEDHLRERDVTTLVFCGCNFPNCPRTSIYEASERDFRVVLARDAVSGLYERGEMELAGIGVHLASSADVVERL
jgi:nicotinamidase-related amidase